MTEPHLFILRDSVSIVVCSGCQLYAMGICYMIIARMQKLQCIQKRQFYGYAYSSFVEYNNKEIKLLNNLFKLFSVCDSDIINWFNFYL